MVKQITFLTDLAKKLADLGPLMELFDPAFIFFFQNKSSSPQLETLQKQGSLYFFNPYEGLGWEFFKHWNKFLIWTLISRQAQLVFSWVSFPKTRLQTDTARRLSRGSRKAPGQLQRPQTAEAPHIQPVWAGPWFAT